LKHPSPWLGIHGRGIFIEEHRYIFSFRRSVDLVLELSKPLFVLPHPFPYSSTMTPPVRRESDDALIVPNWRDRRIPEPLIQRFNVLSTQSVRLLGGS
jgi:hypothetical protein